MVLRVHPGIGVARVGDSPESFIGPETVDIPPTPAGGYRDDEGRIRRQASRFRVFDDLTPVPGTSVIWSVTFGVAASNGTATISGVDQVVTILNGTTIMAELRTDGDGNLLVLSCQIDSTASNGCGDGPVHATVSGAPAVASWIVIIPPDFAPGILPKLPYSFLFRDWLSAHGFLSPPGATTPVSFRREIYPAIRGRTSMSPTALLAAPDPTTAVPFYVAAPGEPSNIEGSYLHSVVEHFHSGTLVNDWSIPTPLDPDALDLGPLSFVDGACPGGWELRFSGGGVQTATLPFASAELRFAPGAVTPGVLPSFFGWAADVPACWNEWATVTHAPVPIGDWRTRGFMVDTGSGLVYQDTHTIVSLLTGVLDFGPVQRGSAVARRIEFSFEDYFFVPLPFQFVTLPPPLEVLTLNGTVGDSPSALTVIFNAAMNAPLGPVTLPSLEVHVDGQVFFVPSIAEIVPAETTQLALVLDCSASMAELRGDGQTKLFGLKAAVEVVIHAARAGDGVAVAPFSDDALLGSVARTLGDASDSRRTDIHNFVDALHIVANTSIGDGILSARSLLDATPDSFDHEALIVITDGVETAPHWLSEVTSSIHEDTFAIGIGTSANVNEDHLREITAGHRGYLLLTGETDSGSNHYVLEKYLLQILAGATNDHVILDPVGSVVPGIVSREPFRVSDLEFRVDVAVVADRAPELELGILGPDGTAHTFEELAAQPGVEIVRRPRLGLARLPVPLDFTNGDSWGPGTWTLLLMEKSSLSGRTPTLAFREAAASQRAVVAGQGKPISYAAVVNARSSLALTAHIAVPTLENTRLAFEASVTYAGVPLRSTPQVFADVLTPLGSTVRVPLGAAGDGRFVGELATTARGDYSARIRARGFSPRGHRFARELALTPSLGIPPSPDPRRDTHPCKDQAHPPQPSRLKDLFECWLKRCDGRRR